MPGIILPSIKRPYQRRILAGSVIVLGILLLAGLFAWLAGPSLVRSVAAEQIGAALGRKVSLGEVKINPLKLAMQVRDVVIHEPDGVTPAVSVGELYLNTSIASVRRWAPVLDALHVRQPMIRVVRVSGQRYNFSDIVDKLAQRPESPPARFSINNIEISEGRINYDDEVLDSRHEITAFNLTLPFLSNLPYAAERYATPAFSANVNGSPLVVDGQSLPFSPTRQTALEINLDALDLPHYMAFLPVELDGKLASGLLDTRLQLDFQQDGDRQSLVLSGNATLRNLNLVDGAAAPLLQWKSLVLELDRSEPLGRDIQVKTVRLDAPEVWLSRTAEGVLNVQQLIRTQPASAAVEPAQPASTSASGQARILGIGQIAVVSGSAHVRDGVHRDASGQAATLELRDITASLNGFSTADASEATLALAFKLNEGASIGTEAGLRFAGQALQGKLTIADLKPRDFQPWLAALFAGDLGNTAMDSELNYRLAWPQSGMEMTIQPSSARLRDVHVSLPKQKNPALRAPEVRFDGLQLDLAGRSMSLEAVSVDGAQLQARRDIAGNLDLMALMPPASKPAANAVIATTANPQVEATPWRFEIRKLNLAKSAVDFSDAAVAMYNDKRAAQTQLRDIDVSLSGLSYPLGEKNTWPLALSLRDMKSGRISAAGSLSPAPLAADLKLDIRSLDVPTVQPYFAQFSNAAFTSGQMSTKGHLIVSLPQRQPLRASYIGNLDLNGVRTIDRVSGSDFMRWRSLGLSSVNAQVNTQKNPLVLTLGDIALSDFFARMILNADGRLNLADIRARPELGAGSTSLTEARTGPADAAPSEPQAPGRALAVTQSASTGDGPDPVIRMGRITLDKGNINFSDFFVRPNYTTNLTGLGGSISAVASDAPKPAEIALNGKIDGDAPLRISGHANPFATPLFLDVAAHAEGVELTRLTPYAAKYAGYPITKGKLTVDVKYHIEDGKLEASNKLFLDQLTFGDKVDSPDATTLPVLLAVALLKNSRGEIDINLPVSGSLSDPQFSIGGVIVRVIVNLLARAITAPFSLLASAFGGGNADQLSYVEFAPGGAEIGPAQQEKLATLSGALNDRPALKLEIAGRIDPVADRDGAKKAWVERLVRAQKRREMIAQGSGADVADVVVTPEEYPKFVELAFRTERFEVPRKAMDQSKPPSVAQMLALMIEHAPIDDAELKILADRRALRVKKYLEEEGKIAVERLFLVAPRLTAEGIKDQGSPSRVDFAMQL